MTCDFALVHRDATLSPAARAFVRILLDVVGGQPDPVEVRAVVDSTLPDQQKSDP